MSSHAASKHEDKTKEQLLELVGDLEDEVERLEFDLSDAEDYTPAEPDISFDLQDVNAMYEAFHLGKESQAIEIAKRIACQHTGRLL